MEEGRERRYQNCRIETGDWVRKVKPMEEVEAVYFSGKGGEKWVRRRSLKIK